MAKFPGKIESANPKEFAIVNATEVAGGRSVATVADLYKIPIAILSKSKGAVPTDAEGQRWYVVSEKKEYRLINFAQHGTASGWKVVEEGGGKGAVESVNGKTGVVELEAADIVVSVENGVKKSQAELNQETENSISYLSNSTLGKSIEVTGIKVRLNRAPYSDTEVLIPVQKGLECGLLTPAMAQTILDNEDSLVALQEQVDGIVAKKDGATFTPSVAPNGDLSWTNDMGKPNPATVNLMGKPGAPGAKGDQGNTGSSVDYPFELVNNLTEGGVDKALTAEQGKILADRCANIPLMQSEIDTIDEAAFESAAKEDIADTNMDIQYSGEWTTGNGFHKTIVPKSSISYTFEGSGISFKLSKKPNGGKIRINVDDFSWDIDLFYSAPYEKDFFSYKKLKNGRHLVTITLLDPSSKYPQRNDFSFYGFSIFGNRDSVKKVLSEGIYVEYGDLIKEATVVGPINGSGSAGSPQKDFRRTNLIPCEEGQFVVLDNVGQSSNLAVLAFYNDNNMSTANVVETIKGKSTYSGRYDVPSGAKYLALSCRTDNTTNGIANAKLYSKVAKAVKKLVDINNAESAKNNVQKLTSIMLPQKVHIKIAPETNIYLFGDSISASVNGTGGMYKEVLEDATGANVIADGNSGASSANLANMGQINKVFAANPDIIMTMFGANDMGKPGTVGTFDGTNFGEPIVEPVSYTQQYSGNMFIQAADWIIHNIVDHYSSLKKQIGMDDNSEPSPEQTQQMYALKKPHLIICTPLREQRNGSTSDYSRKENWIRKRNAIVEVCNKYNVHCCDTYSLWDIDMSKEPFYQSVDWNYTNHGNYTIDGLHPNKNGYQILVRIVTAEFM